jgi:hypothetical protein
VARLQRCAEDLHSIVGGAATWRCVGADDARVAQAAVVNAVPAEAYERRVVITAAAASSHEATCNGHANVSACCACGEHVHGLQASSNF